MAGQAIFVSQLCSWVFWGIQALDNKLQVETTGRTMSQTQTVATEGKENIIIFASIQQGARYLQGANNFKLITFCSFFLLSGTNTRSPLSRPETYRNSPSSPSVTYKASTLTTYGSKAPTALHSTSPNSNPCWRKSRRSLSRTAPDTPRLKWHRWRMSCTGCEPWWPIWEKRRTQTAIPKKICWSIVFIQVRKRRNVGNSNRDFKKWKFSFSKKKKKMSASFGKTSVSL